MPASMRLLTLVLATAPFLELFELRPGIPRNITTGNGCLTRPKNFCSATVSQRSFRFRFI
jgi:hypothetical protein